MVDAENSVYSLLVKEVEKHDQGNRDKEFIEIIRENTSVKEY
jgi:hypothetical protein